MHINRTMRNQSRTSLAWALVSLVFFLQGALMAIDQRSRYPEDWISFTNTRFVRSVAVGFNNVYFGTTEGILVYDMSFKKWLDPITISDGLPDQNIRMIAVEPDDSRVYVSTPSGIYMYETVFQEWSLSDLFPLNLLDDNPDLISNFQQYIPPFGFHALSPNLIKDSQLRDFPVVSAAENQSGDIWIATWGLGPARIENYGIELELMTYGPFSSNCHAMLKDGDRFFFGGRNDLGGGDNALTIWNISENTWSYFEARYDNSFISDQVNDIARAGDYIYLATDFGLVRLNPDGSQAKSYYPPAGLKTDLVLSLEYDRGNLFLGTDEGLFVLDVKKDSIDYMGGTLVGTAAVFDLLAYKNDLWVGSDRGSVRYDYQTNKFYRYSTTGGVLLGITYDIEPDPIDGLWFATEDFLIWMSDRFDENERYSVDADLNGYHPNKILVQERYLWAATDYGLYRYDRLKHYWKHYTTSDGLIDNLVYDLVLDGDYLWMATAAGISRYYWNNPTRGEDL